MAADLIIKVGDRLPVITRTFTVDGQAVNLAGASVRFKAKPVAGGSVVIDSVAIVTNPSNGVVDYEWSATDASLPAGFYFAWFEATINSRRLSAPNDGFITLQITQDTATFTYGGDPAARDLDKVRFLLHDVDPDNVLLTDSEIAFLLDEWGNAYEAARAGAEIISSKFAQRASYSKTVGDLTISEQFQQQAGEFRALADRLAKQALRSKGPVPLASATLTRAPQFTLGVHDNG